MERKTEQSEPVTLVELADKVQRLYFPDIKERVSVMLLLKMLLEAKEAQA